MALVTPVDTGTEEVVALGPFRVIKEYEVVSSVDSLEAAVLDSAEVGLVDGLSETVMVVE